MCINPFTILRNRFFFLLLFIFPVFASASNYYWVGGPGNWSDYANHWATTSGGLVFHVQEPTPFDDVYFDTNSFPTSNSSQDVSVTTTILTCNSMNWTGVTNHPTFNGNSSTGEFDIYGSLTLDTGMTWSYNGTINCLSTNVGNTIKCAHQSLSALYMTGAGGSWALQDSLFVFTLASSETFYSNNNYIKSYGISFSGPTYLGTSTIDFYSQWNVSPLSLLSADSTIINCISSGVFTGGNHTYNKLNFTQVGSGCTINGNNQFKELNGPSGNLLIQGNNFFQKANILSDLTIQSSNNFDTLYLNNPGHTIILQSGSIQIINDTFSLNGSCTGLTSVQSSIAGQQATISKASGNVTSSYLLMQDINANGGANFTANNSVVISNVSGWAVPVVPAQNLYWVGGTGNWDDPSHWSTTSGGTGGSCLPTLYDNVYFDANSFTASTSGEDVNINVLNASCLNMDWTGALYHPTLVGNANIYASLTLIDSMNCYGTGFTMLSNLPGNTITSGKHQLGTLYITGSGSFLLQDSLYVSTFASAGTFYSNNNYITSYSLSFAGPTYLGTSTIDFSSQWNATPSIALYADSTIINCLASGNFTGGNHSYNILNFTQTGSGTAINDNNQFRIVNGQPGGNFSLHGNNTFGKAIFNSEIHIYNSNIFDTLYLNNPGLTVALQAGSTQTINDTISLNGTCAGLTSMQSSIAGQQATISKASGNVTSSYLLMQDINAIGGANFTANNSVVVSNVSGWSVPVVSAQNLYWVGGTGNWDDPSHWSTTSGGTGGSCLPTLYDNVYFDANSFTASTSGEDVNINVINASCLNMDWTGALYHPTLMGAANIYGSLTLIDSMSCYNSGFTMLSNLTGNTITSGKHQLGTLYITGSGTFFLQDSLFVSTFASDGTFYSNNNYIKSYSLSFAGPAYLGTSTIEFSNQWIATPSITLDADSTVIIGNYAGVFTGGNQTYNILNFSTASSGSIYGNNQFKVVNGPFGNLIIQGNNFFEKATVNSDLTIQSANIFDTLYLNNPGHTVTLPSGISQNINSSLEANASGGFPISLVSSTPGIQSTILIPAGDTVCLNYIYMQDQNAAGGGIFYAGIYSSDITNNSGWQFSSCVQPISDVWPGDANYDLIADNFDLLNIGIAYNQSGFVRPGASTTYVAQPCLDWPSQFITGINTKHADTDGNGIVNMDDTLAVYLNYGITHPFRLSGPDSVASTAPDLYFMFPGGSYTPGSWVDVNVDLGTMPLPATDVYGIAFTVNYPSAMIVQNSMSVDYSGSWLVNPGNNIHLEKNFFANDKIDFGFSRINHNNSSGNGKIVNLHFQADTSASGPLMFTFTNILLDDANGNSIPVHPINGSVIIGINEHPQYSAVSIYPNPTSGKSVVDLGQLHQKENSVVEVLDLSGRTVQTIPAGNSNQIQLDLSVQSKGIYFIRILLSDGSTLVRKVVKE